jgi:hypothetical protein
MDCEMKEEEKKRKWPSLVGAELTTYVRNTMDFHVSRAIQAAGITNAKEHAAVFLYGDHMHDIKQPFKWYRFSEVEDALHRILGAEFVTAGVSDPRNGLMVLVLHIDISVFNYIDHMVTIGIAPKDQSRWMSSYISWLASQRRPPMQ